MASNVHVDSKLDDDARRASIYDGQLFVYSARDSVRRFALFAQEMIREAFAPLDPETAQFQMPVERFAQILAELKPRFIHHPQSKAHVQEILRDLGCDAEQTYFDVPRLRSSTSDNYLTSGIAYAWHPHRDTWYSAPQFQVNFWMPVFEIDTNNAMAFHPPYWGRGVENSSAQYNYYRWNKIHRGPDVAKLLTEDPRPLPRATSVELEPQLRLLPAVGGMQELVKRGIIAPSFVVSLAHTEEDIDRTIDAVADALVLYRRALDGDVAAFLDGRPVKPVFRRLE